MNQHSEQNRISTTVCTKDSISHDTMPLGDIMKSIITQVEGNTMKSIIVQVEGSATALAVPYSEVLLNVLINAKVVKLDTGYYPQTGTKFKLQDNQVRVEVVNDSALDNSDAIEKMERKKRAEHLAKLKAEIAYLEGRTE